MINQIHMATLLLAASLVFKTCHCSYIEPPLLLTPMIEKGEICEAQILSLVRHQDIPRSHSGFITVDKNAGNHLFFWLFPAMNSDPQSPLLMYLNGGPGISSMVGLLYENGPLRLIKKKDETVWFTSWNMSWAQHFSMLYIDQPVGVGFSYTETKAYRTTQEGYVKDLYDFLLQFYKLFPKYMNTELYIGGQSYAGKYVPAFAHHLHKEIRDKRSSIPLKGVYLGSPNFDPETQGKATANLFEALGMISKKQADDFREKFDRFVRKKLYLNKSTGEIMYGVFLDVGIPPDLRDNLITMVAYPSEDLNALFRYEEIRHAVHAGHIRFETFNGDVYDYLKEDIMVTTKSKLATLMNNYKVLIYSGDLDGVIGPMTVDAALMSAKWSHQEQFKNSVRKIWGKETDPKGYFSSTGKLCRVVFRATGHRVPHDQPEHSLDMIQQFVKFGCIQQ